MKQIKMACVAGLLILASASAMAKWKLGDQINMVTGQINAGISQLQGRIQAGGLQGVYAEVGRSNDIFTFCREGVPLDFWVGVNPVTGQFQVTNWWYVNPQWIPYYVTLCPHGGPTPGGFTGGTGSMFRAGPDILVPLIPHPH
jgi:hypothetical protein